MIIKGKTALKWYTELFFAGLCMEAEDIGNLTVFLALSSVKSKYLKAALMHT